MSAKINQPSPQIFTSDPLEQIYAKNMFDPVMGGLAAMFATNANNRRMMDQNTYMQGVSESNKIAAQVAQQEAAQKHGEELLKGALKMAELGQPGDTMPILQAIIQSGTLGQGTDLNREFIKSKIAQNSRDPNGGGDKVSGKVDIGPGGAGFITYDVKGRDPVSVAGKLRELQINQLRANNLPTNAAESSAKAEEMLKRRAQIYGGNVPQ